MSDALLHRLATTPISDVLRGRLTGRIDYAKRITASGLPDQVGSLIDRVIRRARLKPAERMDVADELIAHFADGLEAGASPEQLVSSFGDERQAARLIRRAKIRNRSLLWHALRGVRLAVAALVAFYIGLAVVYYTGKPSPSVNYTALLNERIESVPADQRAWPLYRRALLKLWPSGPDGDERRKALNRAMERKAGRQTDALAPELEEWLSSHQEQLELLRQGSRLPSLGFVLGPGGSAYDAELWPDLQLATVTTDPAGEPLISVQLPYLNHMRELALWLDADAQLATERNEATRVNADIQAMLGIARQTRGVLIEDLVGMGVATLAVGRIDAVLQSSPQLLADSDLTKLAHLLAGPSVAGDLISVDPERMLYSDVLQRMYTDDGSGDGRMTPEGLAFLIQIAPMTALDRAAPWPSQALGPAAMLAVGSRREQKAAYDQMMDIGEAQLHRPARETDWAAWNRTKDSWQTFPASARYVLPDLLVPSLQGASRRGEMYLGSRDGALIGIAVELYRRERGSYPPSLNVLTPTLLPEVPVDRITGGPLIYKLVDGRPLVYSVGADRDDDGGRVTKDRNGNEEPFFAVEWDNTDPADGDWVIYGLMEAAPATQAVERPAD